MPRGEPIVAELCKLGRAAEVESRAAEVENLGHNVMA